jgi:hypothetical protein
MLLTTHRIILTKDSQGVEIPLEYIESHDTGGGMLFTPRVELTLMANRYVPFYLLEYHAKVLNSDLPKKS